MFGSSADRFSANQGLLARALRLYLRSGARGSTRATFMLARRLKSLQAVAVTIDSHRLYVDLRDGLSHGLLAGSPWATVPWEVDEQNVMRQLIRTGDRVFDIGAHIGLHTVLFSELVGPTGEVHAFEPNAAKASTLAVTISSLRNARLHPVALGERAGRATLFVPEDQSMASLADWTGGRVAHAQPVGWTDRVLRGQRLFGRSVWREHRNGDRFPASARTTSLRDVSGPP
jgi:hypothetical protein